MFLAVIARPRTDFDFGMSFDGKIRIWPLVYKEAAKRNCRNRSAGMVVTKPILSVTKEVIRSFMIDKVLPYIQEKWPNFRDGFDIKLYCQHPNSPDMNVLDLGFYRAIGSMQHQEAPTNIDEFILAVLK
ncbi:hypothetical protein M5689_000519 [Euphorbia peplus]|nr:hypothetical protein M5689_000519 [Euphorbia peplus]